MANLVIKAEAEHGVAPEVGTVEPVHRLPDSVRHKQYPGTPAQQLQRLGYYSMDHFHLRGQCRLQVRVYIYNIGILHIRLRDLQGQGQTPGGIRIRKPG